jgi:protein-glutamine gamma-glutamyltransferase
MPGRRSSLKAEVCSGRSVGIATLAMVILATFAIELAIADPAHPPLAVLASASGFLIAPMLVAATWVGRRKHQETSHPLLRQDIARITEVAAIIFLLLLPFALHPVMAAWTGKGLPLEVVLMASLRNLGLGLAALARRPNLTRLAALVSLFLAMIASSMGDGPTVVLAVGAYSIAGVLWLMFVYWEGLSPSTADGRRSRPPVLAMIAWASAFAILVAVTVAVGPARAATILAGLVPSSGGTGDNDPEARGGVNDGDNEVAASMDPKSIGFTESEVYLESDRPSLYDSFSEQYGEPIKPKGKQERMVAMGPQNIETKDRPTENLHAGRTFPTARRRPTREAGRGAERQAKALVYVKGETPLHIGLAAYDRFDGVTWEEEPHCGQHCPLELVPGGGAWLRMDLPSERPFAGLVIHQIKIGTLDSSPLPIPAHVTRLRVGSVNRPDFFGWAQAGLLRMVERTVPAGTVIDTESRTLDPRRLRSIEFDPGGSSVSRRYLDIPESLAPGVAGLVRSWVDAVPRGWSQVEAVVAGVRGHCLHDRLVPVSDDVRDVVGHFLLRSRCGPDYQFASATAISLRLLGYPSRVVGGYYAAPGRSDARTRHTPVTAEDVHFWVEVLLPGGTWAAVEPTPGYDLMGPALSLGEQIAEFLRVGWLRLRSNALLIVLGLVASVMAIGFRRRILDGASTLSWWLPSRGPARDRVLRTFRLMELRLGRAGLRRPPGRTPLRWCRSIAMGAPGESRAELERLLEIASWASHAPVNPTLPLPWPEPDIDLACRRAVRTWTLSRLVSQRRSLIPEGIPS